MRKGSRWEERDGRERTCGKKMEGERAGGLTGKSWQERDWEERERTGKQIEKRARESGREKGKREGKEREHGKEIGRAPFLLGFSRPRERVHMCVSLAETLVSSACAASSFHVPPRAEPYHEEKSDIYRELKKNDTITCQARH